MKPALEAVLLMGALACCACGDGGLRPGASGSGGSGSGNTEGLVCHGADYYYHGEPFHDCSQCDDANCVFFSDSFDNLVSVTCGGATVTCNEPAVCGNGAREAGESCDGETMPCPLLDQEAYGAGTATCSSACNGWDDSACLKNCTDADPFCHQHAGLA